MTTVAAAPHVHRGRLAPAVRDAAATALADAFAHDPWARYVRPRPDVRADAAVMRVPVVAAARHGGVLVVPRGDGEAAELVGVSTWVPARRSGGDLLDAVRAGALTLPATIGPRAFARLLREEADTAAWARARLRSDDAWLWVLGVRRDAHGAGVGRLLVEATVADARTAGHPRTALVTHNPCNVPLYTRLGFTVVDRTRRGALVVHLMARP